MTKAILSSRIGPCPTFRCKTALNDINQPELSKQWKKDTISGIWTIFSILGVLKNSKRSQCYRVTAFWFLIKQTSGCPAVATKHYFLWHCQYKESLVKNILSSTTYGMPFGATNYVTRANCCGLYMAVSWCWAWGWVSEGHCHSDKNTLQGALHCSQMLRWFRCPCMKLSFLGKIYGLELKLSGWHFTTGFEYNYNHFFALDLSQEHLKSGQIQAPLTP